MSFQAIPPELQRARQPQATAIVTDVDDGTGPDEELPEPSKKGVYDVARDEQGKPLADGIDPGSEEIPYSRTGWAPQLGWPSESALEAESLLDHATWVEGSLPDHLFGGMFREPSYQLVPVSHSVQIGITTPALLSSHVFHLGSLLFLEAVSAGCS